MTFYFQWHNQELFMKTNNNVKTVQTSSVSHVPPPYIISKHFQKGLKTFQSLPPEGITIFGSQLHTHLTGLRVITRHVRDGRELLELNRDNHYSTHFQEIRLLKRPVRVLPVSRVNIIHITLIVIFNSSPFLVVVKLLWNWMKLRDLADINFSSNYDYIQ